MKKTASTKREKEAAYLRSIDLNSWWEEFCAYNKNGMLMHKTAWSFIQKKTKDPWQRKYLYWLLGPKAEIGTDETPQFRSPQYDWVAKRERGFWYSSSSIEGFQKELNQLSKDQENVKHLGKINAEQIAMLQAIAKQVNREFGGQLMLDNLDPKENAARVQLFFGIQKQILELSTGYQKQYAKTQGVDLDRISEMLQLMGSTIGAQAQAQLPSQDDDASDTMKAILNMTLRKAKDMNMEVPDKDIETLVLETYRKPKTRVN